MRQMTFKAAALMLLLSTSTYAELESEPIGKIEKLGAPEPHWIWVADFAFFNMPDGRSYLYNGDTGQFLGMLNHGFAFNSLTIPSHYKEIYAAETYYDRGVRGNRAEVVSIYDPKTLEFKEEIKIPAKRSSNMPNPGNNSITDDDKFMLVYNMTPQTSVSVIDVGARKFVGEVEIPGCALAFPAGDRQFLSICGDGTLLTTTLDNDGEKESQSRTPSFFDVNVDPVTEKPARWGDSYVFATFAGMAHVVSADGAQAPWSLVSKDDAEEGWRIGGAGHLAVHQKTNRFYSLMHQGGEDTHKDPGTEVWVYDLNTKQRVDRIALKEIATSIHVTQDDTPLMTTAFIAVPAMEIYDAMTGEHLRSISEVGSTPTLMLSLGQ